MADERENGPACLLIAKAVAGARAAVFPVAARATLGARGDVRVESDGVLAEHARLELHAGAWSIVPIDGAVTLVNGVPLRKPWTLRTGDHIGLGSARLVFVPTAADRAPEGNGFSRARRHIRRTVDAAPDDERKLLEALAELERRVDDAERFAAVHPALEHMEKGRFEQAEALLVLAARAYPDDAEILVQLALCQARNDKLPAAQKTLTRAARFADGESAKAVSDLQKQVEQALAQKAAAGSLERAMERLQHQDHAGALAILAGLAPSVRERSEVRYLEHVARWQRLAGAPAAARAAGDSAASIAAGLEEIARQIDDDDLQREVQQLLDQVRRMR